SIAEAIKPRAIRTGATKAVITVDMLLGEEPALLLSQATQARELLFDGLSLGLAAGRDPRRESNSHELPPVEWCYWANCPTLTFGNSGPCLSLSCWIVVSIRYE